MEMKASAFDETLAAVLDHLKPHIFPGKPFTYFIGCHALFLESNYFDPIGKASDLALLSILIFILLVASTLTDLNGAFGWLAIHIDNLEVNFRCTFDGLRYGGAFNPLQCAIMLLRRMAEKLPVLLRYQSLHVHTYFKNSSEKLKEGEDIYIYQGDKSFCSTECRENFMVDEMEGEPESMQGRLEAPFLHGSCMQRNYWQKTNFDQILECAKEIRERGHSLKNCPNKSEGNLKKFAITVVNLDTLFPSAPSPLRMLITLKKLTGPGVSGRTIG
ncbi:hypothetical protein ZEAMMB73_Zm00001d049961 [Zea mays]|uniref:Uncharacterized protein n=1 Tax=Zea mays TaxID=4577 RepID=A0A1D6PZ14_MAIZE|nr:hypothetical protein ZEAMMB73_Zm00001d049961 [Zea mays]